MRTFLMAAAVVALGCGGQSAPSAPTTLSVSTNPFTPIVLSGQSNAVYLSQVLPTAYTYGVLTAAQNGQPIEQWAEGLPLWTQLSTDLQRRPILALVWWQGESNSDFYPAGSTDYAHLLPAFMARVRALIPTLPIVIVRVLPTPGMENVRAAQQAYVASDPRAVLVSVDDLPTTDGLHFNTMAAYSTAADRILAAIHSL